MEKDLSGMLMAPFILVGLAGGAFVVERCREIYWLSRPWKEPPPDLRYLRNPTEDNMKAMRVAKYGPAWTHRWLAGGTVLFWLIAFAGNASGSFDIGIAVASLAFYGVVVPVAILPIDMASTTRAMFTLIGPMFPALFVASALMEIIAEMTDWGDWARGGCGLLAGVSYYAGAVVLVAKYDIAKAAAARARTAGSRNAVLGQRSGGD